MDDWDRNHILDGFAEDEGGRAFWTDAPRQPRKVKKSMAKSKCGECGGSGTEPITVPQFMQLLSTPHGLFALAVDGTVWVYCSTPRNGWKQIVMRAL